MSIEFKSGFNLCEFFMSDISNVVVAVVFLSHDVFMYVFMGFYWNARKKRRHEEKALYSKLAGLHRKATLILSLCCLLVQREKE
jgi:hypothetical protein